MIEIKSMIGSESEVALSGVCLCVCFIVYSLVPSGSPVNVSAEAVSSSRILLTWAALPQEQKNGVILGYKVNKKTHSHTPHPSSHTSAHYHFLLHTLTCTHSHKNLI